MSQWYECAHAPNARNERAHAPDRDSRRHSRGGRSFARSAGDDAGALHMLRRRAPSLRACLLLFLAGLGSALPSVAVVARLSSEAAAGRAGLDAYASCVRASSAARAGAPPEAPAPTGFDELRRECAEVAARR
jgi:hypothetical protein